MKMRTGLYCDCCGADCTKMVEVPGEPRPYELCPECHEMWRGWSRLERRVLMGRKGA